LREDFGLPVLYAGADGFVFAREAAPGGAE